MSGLLIGYARVSTDAQDLTAQRDALVVTKLDRLVRSLPFDRDIVDDLTRRYRRRPGGPIRAATYHQHPSLRAIEVVALVPSPRPALFLRIAAVVQVGAGARERNLWWKLELDDELERHWRLVDAYARPELRALRDH